jgi:hypothetical protein
VEARFGISWFLFTLFTDDFVLRQKMGVREMQVFEKGEHVTKLFFKKEKFHHKK